MKGKEKGDGEGGGKERGREEERKGMDGKGFAGPMANCFLLA